MVGADGWQAKRGEGVGQVKSNWTNRWVSQSPIWPRSEGQLLPRLGELVNSCTHEAGIVISKLTERVYDISLASFVDFNITKVLLFAW